MPISDAEKPFSAASRADAPKAANTSKSFTSALHITGRRAIAKMSAGRELFSLEATPTSDHVGVSHRPPRHGKKSMLFWGRFEKGGPGHLLIDRTGCSRKNFQKFLEDSELSGTDAARVAVGGLCDATNQELSKSSCAKTSRPTRHQYGLQIAEGMVRFFGSYERKLEKYWTKTLFFQVS
jgi:hypothetical protein